jgi:hypothetical protein
MVDIGNGGLRNFHEAAENDFQPMWWKCRKSREAAISTFPGSFPRTRRQVEIREHRDPPVTPRRCLTVVEPGMPIDVAASPPSPEASRTDLVPNASETAVTAGLTADRGVCVDFYVPITHWRKPMAPTVTAMPSTRMSEAEWQTRVDLAACYRLVDLFGWSDLCRGSRTTS